MTPLWIDDQIYPFSGPNTDTIYSTVHEEQLDRVSWAEGISKYPCQSGEVIGYLPVDMGY